jgi:hypothetical protein
LADLIGKVGMLPVQGLASDNHELLLAGDSPGSAKDVINLPLLH